MVPDCKYISFAFAGLGGQGSSVDDALDCKCMAADCKYNNNTYHLFEALLCTRLFIRSFEWLPNKAGHQGKYYYSSFIDEETDSENLK